MSVKISCAGALFIFSIVSDFGISAETILASPIITNWGKWGIWENCSDGQFAIGFQLRVERKYDSYTDNSALNGISLLCGKPGSRNVDSYAKSTVGDFGKLGKLFYCNGLLAGFQLRSESSVLERDDSAANNLKGFCRVSSGQSETIEGDGHDWGEWTAEQHCQRGEAICGIQTQVQLKDESDASKNLPNPLGMPKRTMFYRPSEKNKDTNIEWERELDDETGLNNVKMKCCKTTNGTTCTPTDKWESVITCNNLEGINDLTCSYEKTVGTHKSNTDKKGGDTSNTLTAGVEIGAEALGVSFKASLGTSHTTGHNWGTESTETFQSENKHTAQFIVPPRTLSTLYQVVGHCGDYRINTAHFRKSDTEKEDERNSKQTKSVFSTAKNPKVHPFAILSVLITFGYYAFLL